MRSFRPRRSRLPPGAHLPFQNEEPRAVDTVAGFNIYFRQKPIETGPVCGPSQEALYACFLSSGVGVSGGPFKESLKLRMPSPKPLATSGIFLPPNRRTATTRMTNNSGKPIERNICGL